MKCYMIRHNKFGAYYTRLPYGNFQWVSTGGDIYKSRVGAAQALKRLYKVSLLCRESVHLTLVEFEMTETAHENL